MNYKIRAFNCGTFWVPGPEVCWMHRWGQREERCGPPEELTVVNTAWRDFFGFEEAQIVGNEDQLPWNMIGSRESCRE